MFSLIYCNDLAKSEVVEPAAMNFMGKKIIV